MTFFKKVGSLFVPKQHTPPPPPESKIKMYSMTEVSDLLDTGKALSVSLIKEGCTVCKIPFVGGGTIFVNKKEDIEEEYSAIKEQLRPQFNALKDYIVAYGRQPKFHPYLSYYSVIAIQSDKMTDLKKAFKIQKLKAFL